MLPVTRGSGLGSPPTPAHVLGALWTPNPLPPPPRLKLRRALKSPCAPSSSGAGSVLYCAQGGARRNGPAGRALGITHAPLASTRPLLNRRRLPANAVSKPPPFGADRSLCRLPPTAPSPPAASEHQVCFRGRGLFPPLPPVTGKSDAQFFGLAATAGRGACAPQRTETREPCPDTIEASPKATTSD